MYYDRKTLTWQEHLQSSELQLFEPDHLVGYRYFVLFQMKLMQPIQISPDNFMLETDISLLNEVDQFMLAGFWAVQIGSFRFMRLCFYFPLVWNLWYILFSSFRTVMSDPQREMVHGFGRFIACAKDWCLKLHPDGIFMSCSESP